MQTLEPISKQEELVKITQASRTRKLSLCFLLSDTNILLGRRKKDKISICTFAMPGGELDETEGILENPRLCATRETWEETNLVVNPFDFMPAGNVQIFLRGRSTIPIFHCYLFVARKWAGDLSETEEFAPEWFPQNRIPYDKMRQGDKYWLPFILADMWFEGAVFYDEANTIYLGSSIKVWPWNHGI